MKFISTVAALAVTAYAVELTEDELYDINDEQLAFQNAITELEGVWTDATTTLTRYYEIPVHFDMFVGVWKGTGFLGGEEFQIHADGTWNKTS